MLFHQFSFDTISLVQRLLAVALSLLLLLWLALTAFADNQSSATDAIVPLHTFVVDSRSFEPLNQSLAHASNAKLNGSFGAPIMFREAKIESAHQPLQPAQATPLAEAMVNGWDESFYSVNFESDFMNSNNRCQWQHGDNLGQTQQWGRGNQHRQSGQMALWPAGSPSSNLSQYPNNMQVDLDCHLAGLQGYETLLLAFQMWLQLADAGDTLQILFSSDGQEWRGVEWRGTSGGLNTDWAEVRLYIPELPANGELTLRFRFMSNESGSGEGVWIDDLRLERYNQPASSNNCEQLDPSTPLAGLTTGQQVSKGLNVPPYLEDNLTERIQRLRDSGVHWVRLEFITSPNELSSLYPQTPTHNENFFGRIDLKHYDQLVDSYCQAGIAVLGLLDYRTLIRQDWAISNTLSSDYITAFASVSAQLATYFDDRINVWEVWNEQDLAGTRISPASYAQLLHETNSAIQSVAQQETDQRDQIVFGGLGRIDTRAYSYLATVYAALKEQYPDQASPFDILALHPYSSELYGIETNPEIYFHWPEGKGATVIHKFLALMAENGDGNRPVWITEMGWNRAKNHQPSATCPAISAGLVTDEQQVEYLNRGFDILFRETQSVSKIFWYQYRDTGIALDCGTRNKERARPFAIVAADNAVNSAAVRPVAWWFGLYNGVFQPNQVQSAFRCYATAGPNCPSPTPTHTATATPTLTPTPQPTSSLTSVVFLPVVMREGAFPTPVATITPIPTAPPVTK